MAIKINWPYSWENVQDMHCSGNFPMLSGLLRLPRIRLRLRLDLVAREPGQTVRWRKL